MLAPTLATLIVLMVLPIGMMSRRHGAWSLTTTASEVSAGVVVDVADAALAPLLAYRR